MTGLTGTMMAGLLVLIYLFVTRFPDPSRIPLPESVTLPSGTEAVAFTRGPGWYAVVTAEGEILILDPGSGAVRQTVRIEPR